MAPDEVTAEPAAVTEDPPLSTAEGEVDAETVPVVVDAAGEEEEVQEAEGGEGDGARARPTRPLHRFRRSPCSRRWLSSRRPGCGGGGRGG